MTSEIYDDDAPTQTYDVSANVPLPELVTVSQAFSSRLPSQRVLDMLQKAEGGADFGELAQTQPFRIVAFRALLRDFPDRDPASLWAHAYDVEVEVTDVNPTSASYTTPAPGFADTGG
jgi:hypothetical protein